MIIIFHLCSCQSDNTKTVEGDLYFKQIELENFFEYPDSILAKIEKSERAANKALNEQDRYLSTILNLLVDKNLLRKPFIRIRFDNGVIHKIYMDSSEYRQFQKYSLSDLSRDAKKIRNKAKVIELKSDSLSVLNSLKIISVAKIDGTTFSSK